MGFVINQGGQPGPPGPAGEPGPPGPVPSTETSPWTALTLAPTGATGALQWRTQLAAQTLQLVGEVTFAAAVNTPTLIATLPSTLTVSQLLAIPVACHTKQQGGTADVASLVIDVNGTITIVPNENDLVVPGFWVAHSFPLDAVPVISAEPAPDTHRNHARRHEHRHHR